MDSLTSEHVMELWRATFGEPPAILLEPAQMLAVMEACRHAGAEEMSTPLGP